MARKKQKTPLSLERRCRNHVLSLRAIPPWREHAAIPSFQYAIAPVATLLRNDITTVSPGEGKLFFYVLVNISSNMKKFKVNIIHSSSI